MLTIENLTKSYPGGVTAVKDVCLTVENGDLYGFIGHNGAGKTTTIKSVVGLLPFEKGKITIDGVSVTQDPIRCKSMVAYIPDTPELYDNLTGMQYLNFVSDIYGISKRERSSRINQYATMLEMTDNLNNSVSSYSHGMKQKLSFIAAFVHAPKLLILDEPFVGLDPRAAFSVKTVMKEFCAKGNAIFFSTHVLEVAEKICNKIAIIKNGSLIASGETRTVKGDLSLEEVFLELTEEEKGEA